MQPIDTTRAHCVDPETLAAWVDGGLPAPAAAEVEAHLSTCARCQAVLAALTATDPAVSVVAPAVVLPFWSRRPVQWAAAALASAASITLWTMNRPPTPVPDSVVVQTESAPTPPTPPASAPASAPAELRRGEPTTPTPPRSVPRTAAKSAAAPEAVVVPPPQPTFPPANPVVGLAGARSTAFGTSAEVVVFRPQFEVVAVTNQNAPNPGMRLNTSGAGRGGGGGRAATASELAASALAPAARPPMRWRVNGSNVERSIDAGQSWERLDLDPPFTLSSGSAPYQNVCWLVGQDGVVFRTTNGTSFERMTPPDKVHLLVVVASDALRAMVTAVDGRIFETTDGGVTWKLR